MTSRNLIRSSVEIDRWMGNGYKLGKKRFIYSIPQDEWGDSEPEGGELYTVGGTEQYPLPKLATLGLCGLYLRPNPL